LSQSAGKGVSGELFRKKDPLSVQMYCAHEPKTLSTTETPVSRGYPRAEDDRRSPLFTL
jgi:hypothetical protein